MKKTLILFIALLLSLVLTACGGSNSTSTDETSNANNEGDSNSSNESTESTEEVSAYPEKQVKMVIPYGPGGATDIIFRLVGKYAEENLGTNLVPVNISGASSTTGSREVKGSDPDGYTILASHDVIATAYYAGIVDYSFEAFEPVALLTLTPNIAAVNKDTGITNMEDFVNHVKANPGELKWGMTPGSTSHYFVAEMLDKVGLTEEDVKLIAYQGTSDALTAVLSGEIDGTMVNYTSGKGYLDEGTFVSIGVAHDERLGELPDAETMIEQGIDFTNATSRGIFAPKGTPEEVVAKLSEAYQASTSDPELQAEVKKLGSIVKYLDHNEYKTYVEALHERLGKLAEKMDLQ